MSCPLTLAVPRRSVAATVGFDSGMNWLCNAFKRGHNKQDPTSAVGTRKWLFGTQARRPVTDQHQGLVVACTVPRLRTFGLQV